MVRCSPRTGAVFTEIYSRRNAGYYVDSLSQGRSSGSAPETKRIYATVDNLAAHSAYDVMLFSLAYPRWEFVSQPKYAGYLNLIEPWWKTLRSLALKGRHFNLWVEMIEPIRRATAYWNEHEHPYVWGKRKRQRRACKYGVASLPSPVSF